MHIVIAVGAKPRELGIPSAGFVKTSTDFLELEALPKRIVFIGGGYISFEFAHIAARARPVTKHRRSCDILAQASFEVGQGASQLCLTFYGTLSHPSATVVSI